MATKALYSDSVDGVDALIDIEKVFDVTIPDDQAENMLKVGDLYDYLNELHPAPDGEKCITSMAFYRIRKSLKPLTHETELKPNTPLSHFIDETPKVFWASLKQSSQLNLPHLGNTKLGYAALYLGLLTFCMFLFSLFLLPLPLLLMFLAGLIFACILVIKNDPLELPQNIVNIGDLAKETSRINYGELTKAGARTDDDLRWSILTQLLAAISGNLEAKDITSATPFY